MIITLAFLAAENFDFTTINIDSLNAVATQAYHDGEYQKAADLYIQYMQYDIKNGSVCYNLACCYGLLANDSLATKYLRYAYDNGFTNIEHIKNDPDFEKVRESEIFSKLIKKLDKGTKEP